MGASHKRQFEFSSRNITTRRQHFGTEVNDISDDVNALSSSPVAVGRPTGHAAQGARPAGARREHSVACASRWGPWQARPR